MIVHWTHILAVAALQHLWQSAVLVLLAWLVCRMHKWLDADTRSWILVCALLLAAILPLAVALPTKGTTQSMVAAAQTVTLARPVPQHGAPSSQAPVTVATWPTTWGTALIGVWLLGLLYNLQRLLAGWNAAKRLHQTAIRLSETGRMLPRSFPVGTAIRVSDQIKSPMVVGLKRPCILLPQPWVNELPDATLIHVLRHELAHVRRCDMWISLVQSLCLAVYWWNPLLWWLRAQLDTTREMACDERAATQAGGAAEYAQALLTSVGKILAPNHFRHILAVGIFDTRTTLTRRIEGLLNMNTNRRMTGATPAIAACTAMILAGLSVTLYATPRLGPSLWTGAGASISSHDGARLVAAVRAQRADVIRQLVKDGADIDARLPGDGTALIVAVKHHDVPIVNELIQLGANVNQPSYGNGNPLIAASKFGYLDVAKILVGSGAEVNAIVVGDETPLINAARRGHLPVVKYLIDHGADVNLGVLANGSEWRSPLNQADNAAIRHYLADKGAVPHK